MIDWLFRIASVATFAADLDEFCGAGGYPLLTVDDGAGGRTLPGIAFGPHVRFDFDVLEIVSAGNNRGLHVNARGAALPGVANAGLALAKLDGDLRAYFAAKGTVTNTAPAPLKGGQSWHSTGSTVLIDPAPVLQKRAWL